MKNIALSLFASAILCTFAPDYSFAQTTTREKYLEQAKADFDAATQRFKQQIAEPGKYVPCDAEASYFEKTYANWYIQNESEIWNRFDSLSNVVEYANKKIVELKRMSFQPIVVKGQQTDPNVTFDTVLKYLSDLAIRKKSAKDAGQLNVFEDQTTRPEFSPFDLSLIQVIESLQGMSEQMNASLKDQGVEFKIHFKSTETGYELTLEVKIQDSPQTFKIDLLKSGQAISIEEKDRWAFLSLTKIGPYSVDAQMRYREMFTEAKSKQCLSKVAKTTAGHPYASIAILKGLTANSNGGFQFAYSKETWVCTWGSTGIIEFRNGFAKIITWGGRSNKWPETKVQLNVEINRLGVEWGTGNYQSIWVNFDENGDLLGSHGPVTCRLK